MQSTPMMLPSCRIVVAIPVHDEEAVIGACLAAFARQIEAPEFAVVLLLNNCTDGTLDVVEGLRGDLPYMLHVVQIRLDPARLNAGVARRLAVEQALALVGDDGVVMTTDADSRVPCNWIAANLDGLEAGADAVFGITELDPQDALALPTHLITDEAKVIEFATQLDEIDWLVDPMPHDPWPRHTEHSGASIAIRAAVLRAVGGVPEIALGEDRALFAALRARDARIRHALAVTVTVSGRTVGRAKGGMADTIANRIRRPDEWLDDTLEPASRRLLRATARVTMRAAWRSRDAAAAARLASVLGVAEDDCVAMLESPQFGAGWGALEALSPALRMTPIPTAWLEAEIAASAAILSPLRAAAAPGDPAGSPLDALPLLHKDPAPLDG